MTTPQAALVEALKVAYRALQGVTFMDRSAMNDKGRAEVGFLALRDCAAAMATIDATLAQAEAAQPVAPVLYVSPGQLPKVLDVDPEGAFGTYLPVRKTAAGKFTMPLFAAPQPAEAAPKQEAVAVVTECEACFTPDACRLRGTCDHYAAERLRVAAQPQQPAPEPVARVPLTQEQIVMDGMMMCPNATMANCADAFEAGVRFAERAHGIAAPQTPATTGDTEGRA